MSDIACDRGRQRRLSWGRASSRVLGAPSNSVHSFTHIATYRDMTPDVSRCDEVPVCDAPRREWRFGRFCHVGDASGACLVFRVFPALPCSVGERRRLREPVWFRQALSLTSRLLFFSTEAAERSQGRGFDPRRSRRRSIGTLRFFACVAVFRPRNLELYAMPVPA